LKCRYCNKEFNDHKSFRCHYITGYKDYSINSILDFYNWNLDNLNDIKEFYLKGYSVNEVCNQFKITGGMLKIILNHYNIKKRNLSESHKMEIYLNKIEQTCLNNFGRKNGFLVNDIDGKLKREKTFLKKYGTKNQGGRPEVVANISKALQNRSEEDKLIFVNNIKNGFIKKYGNNITNASQIPEVKEKISATQKLRFENMSLENKRKVTQSARNNLKKFGGKKRTSKFELKFKKFLDNFNIIYDDQYIIHKCNNKSYITIDFYLTEYNIAIELLGDYFHANPNKYKDNHYFKQFNMTAKQIRNKDKRRFGLIKHLGYNLITFWEYDFYNNIEYIEQILKEKINESKIS